MTTFAKVKRRRSPAEPPSTRSTHRIADQAAEAGPEDDPAIRVEGLSKWFFEQSRPLQVLDEISFSIPRAGFVAIVGPSGCGKSTVLNCVVGLETYQFGEIRYEGRAVRGLTVGIGYMTQKDLLLPWRSIVDNVALPLEYSGVARRPRRERAREMLAAVGLQDFASYRPDQLSGGMLKRASLARTLVRDPPTVMMDEPFGNVDWQLRLQLQRQLLDIWEAQRRTIAFVTHDLEEAIALADQVVVLYGSPGRVREIVPIDLPRPRDPIHGRFESEFQDLHRHLASLIGLEGTP